MKGKNKMTHEGHAREGVGDTNPQVGNSSESVDGVW